MKDIVPIHPYKPPGRQITTCNEGGIEVARGASAFNATNDDLDAVMRMYARVRGTFPDATTYAVISQCKGGHDAKPHLGDDLPRRGNQCLT